MFNEFEERKEITVTANISSSDSAYDIIVLKLALHIKLMEVNTSIDRPRQSSSSARPGPATPAAHYTA